MRHCSLLRSVAQWVWWVGAVCLTLIWLITASWRCASHSLIFTKPSSYCACCTSFHPPPPPPTHTHSHFRFLCACMCVCARRYDTSCKPIEPRYHRGAVVLTLSVPSTQGELIGYEARETRDVIDMNNIGGHNPAGTQRHAPFATHYQSFATTA